MKIVDYVILENQHTEKLIKQVKEKILDGRQPLGGVSIAEAWNSQAMVKYEEEIILIDNDDVKKDQIIAGLLECRKILTSGLLSAGYRFTSDNIEKEMKVIDDKIKEYTKR